MVTRRQRAEAGCYCCYYCRCYHYYYNYWIPPFGFPKVCAPPSKGLLIAFVHSCQGFQLRCDAKIFLPFPYLDNHTAPKLRC